MKIAKNGLQEKVQNRHFGSKIRVRVCIEQLQCALETSLACFFAFLFFGPKRRFTNYLALAWWPFLAIFKMVSFLEYLVFFRAVFCIELLKCGCRMDFCMFFGILFWTETEHFANNCLYGEVPS